jgi:hypothetical protein
MSQVEPPSPYLSNFPFENVEGNLFTPVCLRTHWDPTEMLRHIIPQQKVGLPEDFRPWVKVCKNYVTSGPTIPAPMPPKDMVFPTGGEFYPPGRYAAAIDQESILRTLDHPLDKWCPSTKYIPRQTSDMFVAGATVPDRKPISDAFVSELAMPQALLRTDIYTCRSENDTKYFERSGRLFNNPTKQDRYGADKFYALPGGGPRGDPMPHGGVNEVVPTKQAQRAYWPIQQPGGVLPNYKPGDPTSRPIRGFGSTQPPGNDATVLQRGSNPPGTSAESGSIASPIRAGTGCTSFVGVTTCGSSAPAW